MTRSRPLERLPLTTSATTSDEEQAALATSGEMAHRGGACALGLWWLLGLGSLWAWNAFITPTDYYLLVFQHIAFLPKLTSTFTIVGLLSVLVMQPLQSVIPLRRRILGAFVVAAVAFALTSVFVVSASPRSESGRASVLFTLAAISSAAQGFLCASLASYATAFPPTHMAALTTGQAAAGVAVSAFNVLRKLPEASQACSALPAADAAQSSLAASSTLASRYFATSSAAMAACVLAFLWLGRLAVTKAYQRAAQRGAPKSPTVSADSLDSLGSLVRIARGPLLGWGLSMMLLFTGTLLHLPPSPAISTFSRLLTPS